MMVGSLDDVKPPAAYTLAVNRVGVFECGVSELFLAFLILFETLAFRRLSLKSLLRTSQCKFAIVLFKLRGKIYQTVARQKKNVISLANVRYTVATYLLTP